MSWFILSLLRLTPGGLPRSSSDVNRLGVSRKSGSSEMFSYAQSRRELRFEFLEPRTLLDGAALFQPVVASCSGAAERQVRLSWSAAPMGSAAPPSAAFSPQQIQAAYGINLISQDGAGQTIAIIDAYDDPDLVSSSNAAAYATSDLHNFDAYYGLPDFGGPGGPTFTKLDENGGTNYPGTEPSGSTLGRGRSARRGMGTRHRAGGQHRTD